MNLKSVEFGTPFQWFARALETLRRNPRPLLGGFAVLSVLAMVPSVPQMIVDATMPTNLPLRGVMFVISMLWGLLVMPPFLGAAFRLLQDSDRGDPVRPGQVFGGWVDTAYALRMVSTSLLLFVINLAIMALLYLVMPSKDFFIEVFTRSLATAPGGTPDMAGLPDFSPLFLLWMPFVALVLVAVSQVYMFAYARVALDDRRPIPAIVDGALATLRNLLPLTVFAFVAFVGLMVLAMAFGLVFAIVAVIASLISPVLGAIVMIPMYLALMVTIYLVMFGFYYHAWREIFAGDTDPAESPPAATVAI